MYLVLEVVVLGGSEYATGVREFKSGYDAVTYAVALAGCRLGVL
jgi:hypothetical protein